MRQNLLALIVFISGYWANAQCDLNGCDTITAAQLRSVVSDWPVQPDCNGDLDSSILDLVCLINQVPDLDPPELQAIGDRLVTRGYQLQFTVLANDPNGDPLTFGALGLPMGASFDPISQAFDYTPSVEDLGTYPVTFWVDDGFYRVEEMIQLTVKGLTTVAESSPFHLEEEVAVTRETRITFDYPIQPGSVTPQTLSARFGSQELAAWRHISDDLRTVTLFYTSPLPPSARVRIAIDGDNLLDSEGIAPDVDGDDLPGGQYVIDFDTLSLTPLEGTSVSGRVFASELTSSEGGGPPLNIPLEGVRITIDGLETTHYADTDSTGNFTLEPVPAGRFFVHIDGRTVTSALIDGVPTPTSFPAGPYYPFVGKAWTGHAGVDTNAGDVFLPLVLPGTLQLVSATDETTIHFPQAVIDAHPEWADVAIRVPANSLFANDGSPGGMVGIAPVDPNRLPGTLPPGLEPAIVITVQTDGATNFSTPAPVCFPNLPDPTSGILPPAGSALALLSFNHDAGRWEHVGEATVSSDAAMVCTDPGSGITAPGWHLAVPCSPTHLHNPKYQCRQDCAIGIMWGIIDCALSFIPVSGLLQCSLGTALAVAQIARDCANNGASAGCVISVITNLLAQVASECAGAMSHNIPALGQIIACGGGAIGAISSCSCLLNKGGEPWEPRVEAEWAFMQAYHDLAIEILGDPVWSSLDPDDPDLFVKSAQVTEIIETTLAVANDGIDASEESALLALARPSELTASDVQNLIDRLNNTLDLWGQGLFTHAQAGRTDFLDRDLLIARLDGFEATIVDLQNLGVESFELDEPGQRYAQLASEQLADPEPLNPKGVFYRMDALPQWNVTTPPPRFGTLGSGGSSNVVTLPPQSPYRVQYYDPVRGSYNGRFFFSRPNGVETPLPQTSLYELSELDGTVGPDDLDGDRLHNTAEAVIGTDEMNPDTDGDGIEDGAEVEFGLNPLDGLLLNLGIVFQVATPGDAVDVDTSAHLIALAHGASGISLFNAFNGMDPRIIAQVNTPGTARSVAIAADLIAVADGNAGLSIIDVTDPPAASVVMTIPLGGDAQSVDVDLDIAYVGLNANVLAAVDMLSGSVIQRLNMPFPVVDVEVGLDAIYALHADRVSTIAPLAQTILHTTPAMGIPPGKHLFAGTDTLFVIHDGGYATLDLTDPTMPTLVSNAYSSMFWTGMALNGSGLGVTGVNSLGGGGIEVFDVSNPAITTTPALQSFVFAPRTRAVDITNGLAYVAADSGLLVVNYQSYDASGIQPTVSIEVPFAKSHRSKGTWQVEEGKQSYFTAVVNDDIQVRHVTFYVDGEEVYRDGSYPFSFRFITPSLAQQPSFTLQAKATDTGGNVGWSSQETVDLTADTTAPAVINQLPVIGKRTVNLVSCFFDEPIDPATVTAGNFNLVEAGPDGAFDTPDDVPLTPQNVAYVAPSNRIDWFPSAVLPDGVYRATIGIGIADLVGNSLAAPHSWTFRVADAVFWVAADGDFQAGLNWSEGVVPGPTDHVIIDVPGAALITLNTAPARIVQSMEVHDTLRVEGGDLSLGQMDVHGVLDFKHGNIRNATIDNSMGGTLLGGTTAIGVYSCILRDATVVGSMNCSGRSLLLYGSFNLQGNLTVATHSLVVNGTGIFGSGTVSVNTTNITTNASVYTIGAGITVRGYHADIHGQPQNYGSIQMYGGTQCGLSNMTNHHLVSFENTNGTWSSGTNLGTITTNNATLNLTGTFQNNGDLAINDSTVYLNMTAPYSPSQLGSYTRSGSSHIVIRGHMDVSSGLLLNASTGSWELSGAVDALVSNGFIETLDGTQLLILEQPDNDPATLRNLELRTNLTVGEKSHLKFDSGLTLTNSTITLTGSPAYLRGAKLSSQLAGMQYVNGVGTIQSTTSTANDLLAGHSGNHIVIGPGITVTGNGAHIGSNTQVTNQGLIEKSFGGGVLSLKGPLGFTNQGTIRVTAGVLQVDHPLANEGTIDVLVGQSLMLEDDLNMSGTSTITLHFGSLASFGKLTGDLASTSIALDGVLDVQLEGGYLPVLGDSFTIISGNNVSGAFTSVLNQSLGNGTMFQVTVNSADVTLEVVPE